MKLCRDELLLLGGIYQVAALIVSLFTSDIAYAVNGVLYILFWIAVMAIAFNWVPGFVFQLNDRFPRISVFLASIGWIPYFAVLYAFFSCFASVEYIPIPTDNSVCTCADTCCTTGMT